MECSLPSSLQDNLTDGPASIVEPLQNFALGRSSNTPRTWCSVTGRRVRACRRRYGKASLPQMEQLIEFDAEIPDNKRKKFESLCEIHGSELFHRSRNKYGVSTGISLNVKALGTELAHAQACFVVECTAETAAKLHEYLSAPEIHEHFEPTYSSRQSLPAIIVEVPPQKLRRTLAELLSSVAPPTVDEANYLWYDRQSVLDSGTLCGVKVYAIVDGSLRSATIGGCIVAKMSDGHRRRLGMTAGHLLHQDHTSAYIESARSTTMTELGPIRHISTDGTSGGNLDWLLFDLDDKLGSLPNVIGKHKVLHSKSLRGQHGVGPAVAVKVETDSDGLLAGQLSTTSSFLALPGANAMVKALSLSLNHGRGKLRNRE